MSNFPKLNFLPGQRFECTACGKCCKGSWNIAVDDESFQKIKSSGAYGRKKKEGYIPLNLADDGNASVGRSEDGGCVFLRRDNLCEIHGELGMESKPLVCRTYPNMLTNTPDGYFVSLSFACPAVLDNAGQAMEERYDELAGMLAESKTDVPQNVPIKGDVRLAGETVIGWKEYLQLEQHLLAVFKPQQPAVSVLAAAEQIAAAVNRGTVAELLELGFSTSEAASPYAGQLLELFAVNCISIMELEKEPEQRGLFMEQLMTQGVVSLRHGCSLPPFSAQPKARPSDLSLIHYYFQNIVFGKRLTNGSLLNGLLTLAVGLSLLVYYLEVFRVEYDERTSLEKAFELIEGDVVTHSRGLNLLLDELPKALLEFVESVELAA